MKKNVSHITFESIHLYNGKMWGLTGKWKNETSADGFDLRRAKNESLWGRNGCHFTSGNRHWKRNSETMWPRWTDEGGRVLKNSLCCSPLGTRIGGLSTYKRKPHIKSRFIRRRHREGRLLWKSDHKPIKGWNQKRTRNGLWWSFLWEISKRIRGINGVPKWKCILLEITDAVTYHDVKA
jgi:hypothetical protein